MLTYYSHRDLAIHFPVQSLTISLSALVPQTVSDLVKFLETCSCDSHTASHRSECEISGPPSAPSLCIQLSNWKWTCVSSVGRTRFFILSRLSHQLLILGAKILKMGLTPLARWPHSHTLHDPAHYPFPMEGTAVLWVTSRAQLYLCWVIPIMQQLCLWINHRKLRHRCRGRSKILNTVD